LKLVVKIVGALAVVVASFVTTLWLLDRNAGTCPPGRTMTLNRPFAKFSGLAYSKDVAGIVDIPGDAADALTRSRLLLCQDGMLFGSAHTMHDEVAKQGRGRFSHWGNYLVFSTPDNSDPNSNGRLYVAVEPR
jgi:hypothetical protein